MENEITTVEIQEVAKQTTAISSPMHLLELAIMNGNVNVEVLEKLMALKERCDKEEARKAWISAMADFQSACPIIVKSKDGGTTKAGTVAYKFAPLDEIVRQTKVLIKECGFSYTILSDTLDGSVEATCIVRHLLGHCEETKVKFPLVVQTGVMSPPQVIASTLTYAKRYAFCNAFGIITGDEDNDAAMMPLKEMFGDTISEYGDTEYIKAAERTIETANAYRQFLETIPTKEQAIRLKSIISDIPEANQIKIWGVFQKHTKDSVNKFIDELKLKKEGSK